jgi:hypothetical protein
MSSLDFAPEDLSLIQAMVDECIVATHTPMTSVIMYERLGSKLSKQMSQATFACALSASVKEEKILGIVGRQRVGYCRTDTIKKSAPATLPASLALAVTKPHAVPAPRHVSARHIWVGRKLYRLVTTFERMEELVMFVLEGKSGDGDVVFNGKKYSCPSTLFERTIQFLGAWFENECDPVLDDGSGVPVELRLEQ